MARVARLRVYPVKSLDGVDVEAAEVTPGGGLAGDRAYALFGADGEPVTGKRDERVHRLATEFDPATATLTVRPEGTDETHAFDLEGDPGVAEAWFEGFFGHPVTLRRDADRGFADRPQAGPSVVSTATLEAVASWFDELDVHGVRRRLRANVEVDGVPAFWEDRFVGDEAPAFVVGAGDADAIGPPSDGVRVEGLGPCVRCVVPSRDPDTGEPLPGFRERFVERRAATFPDWADREAFPTDYALMLIAQVPEADRGRTLRVGDAVSVVERG